jgi:hypothetical protein
MIGQTGTGFEELNAAVDAATNSLITLAELEFSEENDLSNIQNRNDYINLSEEFVRKLQEADSSLTEEEARRIAKDYFLGKTETSAYASAEEIRLEIASKFGEESIGAIDILKAYINGEISPETFLKIVGSVELKDIENVSDYNTQLEKQRVITAANSASSFANGSKQLAAYLKENYTLEGIDENVIAAFEAELRVVNDTLPEGIDLLDGWNAAL